MARIEKFDPPEKEDYLQWRSSPVTKFYLQQLMNKREEGKEDWAEGRLIGDAGLLAVGKAQGIQDCVDYAISDFEYLETQKEDTE